MKSTAKEIDKVQSGCLQMVSFGVFFVGILTQPWRGSYCCQTLSIIFGSKGIVDSSFRGGVDVSDDRTELKTEFVSLSSFVHDPSWVFFLVLVFLSLKLCFGGHAMRFVLIIFLFVAVVVVDIDVVDDDDVVVVVFVVVVVVVVDVVVNVVVVIVVAILFRRFDFIFNKIFFILKKCAGNWGVLRWNTAENAFAFQIAWKLLLFFFFLRLYFPSRRDDLKQLSSWKPTTTTTNILWNNNNHINILKTNNNNKHPMKQQQPHQHLENQQQQQTSYETTTTTSTSWKPTKTNILWNGNNNNKGVWITVWRRWLSTGCKFEG